MSSSQYKLWVLSHPSLLEPGFIYLNEKECKAAQIRILEHLNKNNEKIDIKLWKIEPYGIHSKKLRKVFSENFPEYLI